MSGASTRIMWFNLQEHRACCNGPINTDGLPKTFGNSQIPGAIVVSNY